MGGWRGQPWPPPAQVQYTLYIPTESESLELLSVDISQSSQVQRLLVKGTSQHSRCTRFGQLLQLSRSSSTQWHTSQPAMIGHQHAAPHTPDRPGQVQLPLTVGQSRTCE